ncbi:RlpA-like double-psi beta-barrel-protein domain-containing protein-containing protein [Cunninghamella echinulata]|nr:RlpA-like double-psi beta-barrel-protein domain-containing protein-containing protein [Cunninghamella echinulata]
MLRSTLLFVLAFFMLAITIRAAPVNHHTLEKRAKTYRGTATFFSPDSGSEGGNMGACGKKESDHDMIVALNRPQYGNMSKKSKWCGKKIKITGPKGTAYARVNDACPGCDHGDLDLTPALFKKVVGKFDLGVGKIKWSLA